MKIFIREFLLLSLFFGSNSFAHGTRGGGDVSCGDRWQAISNDLKTWINDGGPRGLILPSGVIVETYSAGMLSKLQSVKEVRCVGPGDNGYPVKIGNTPKVCVFESSGREEQVTCDFSKFLAMTETDQYVQVHHEYAGLAGFESPLGEGSTYTISNQLSKFLVDVVVKKLAVKPANTLTCQEYKTEAQQSDLSSVSIANLGTKIDFRFSIPARDSRFGNHARLHEALADSFGLADFIRNEHAYDVYIQIEIPANVDPVYCKPFRGALGNCQLDTQIIAVVTDRALQISRAATLSAVAVSASKTVYESGSQDPRVTYEIGTNIQGLAIQFGSGSYSFEEAQCQLTSN